MGDKKNPDCFLMTSRCLLAAGKLEQAEKGAKQAVALGADAAKATIVLADILCRQDRAEDAVAELRKALDAATSADDSGVLLLRLSPLLAPAEALSLFVSKFLSSKSSASSMSMPVLDELLRVLEAAIGTTADAGAVASALGVEHAQVLLDGACAEHTERRSKAMLLVARAALLLAFAGHACAGLEQVLRSARAGMNEEATAEAMAVALLALQFLHGDNVVSDSSSSSSDNHNEDGKQPWGLLLSAYTSAAAATQAKAGTDTAFVLGNGAALLGDKAKAALKEVQDQVGPLGSSKQPAASAGGIGIVTTGGSKQKDPGEVIDDLLPVPYGDGSVREWAIAALHVPLALHHNATGKEAMAMKHAQYVLQVCGTAKVSSSPGAGWGPAVHRAAAEMVMMLAGHPVPGGVDHQVVASVADPKEAIKSLPPSPAMWMVLATLTTLNAGNLQAAQGWMSAWTELLPESASPWHKYFEASLQAVQAWQLCLSTLPQLAQPRDSLATGPSTDDHPDVSNRVQAQLRESIATCPTAGAWYFLAVIQCHLSGELLTSQEHANHSLVMAAKCNPYHAHAFHLLGLLYLDVRKDKLRGVKCLEKAMALNPGISQAGTRLADLHAAAGDASKAEQVCRTAIAASKADLSLVVWALFRMGVYENSAMRHAAGSSYLLEALRHTPRDAKPWLELGRSYRKQGKYMAALKALQRAHDLDETLWAASFELGLVRSALGLLKLACNDFEKVLGTCPVSHAPARFALASTLIRRATDLLDQYQVDEAARCAREAAQHCHQQQKEGEEEGALTSMWAKLCGDALVCLAQTPSPQATAAWDMLASHYDESSSSSKDKGDACATLLEQGQEKQYMTACNMSTVHCSLLFHAQQHYTQAQQAQAAAAQQEEEQAVAASLDVATVMFLRHQLLLEARLAMAGQQQANKDDNDKGKDAWLQAVREAQQLLEEECEATLMTVLQRHPAQVEIWERLGMLFLARRPAHAQHAFVQAARLDPQRAHPYALLGLLYLQHGELDLAGSALMHARSLNHEEPLAWLGQGLLNERIAGRKQDVTGLYARALDLQGPALCRDLYAFALGRMGLYPKCLTHALQLHRARATDPLTTNLLATVYEGEEQYAKAEQCYREAMKQPMADHHTMMHALQRNLARVLIVQGTNLEEAEALLGDAAASTRSGTEDGYQEQHVLLEAMLRAQQGNFEAARDLYVRYFMDHRAHEVQVTTTTIARGLIHLHRKAGRLAELPHVLLQAQILPNPSAAAAAAAAASPPPSLPAHAAQVAQLGLVQCLMAGQQDTAPGDVVSVSHFFLQCLQVASPTYRGSAEEALALAMICIQQGDTPRARRMLLRGLHMHPADTKLRTSLAFFVLNDRTVVRHKEADRQAVVTALLQPLGASSLTTTPASEGGAHTGAAAVGSATAHAVGVLSRVALHQQGSASLHLVHRDPANGKAWGALALMQQGRARATPSSKQAWRGCYAAVCCAQAHQEEKKQQRPPSTNTTESLVSDLVLHLVAFECCLHLADDGSSSFGAKADAALNQARALVDDASLSSLRPVLAPLVDMAEAEARVLHAEREGSADAAGATKARLAVAAAATAILKQQHQPDQEDRTAGIADFAMTASVDVVAGLLSSDQAAEGAKIAAGLQDTLEKTSKDDPLVTLLTPAVVHLATAKYTDAAPMLSTLMGSSQHASATRLGLATFLMALTKSRNGDKPKAVEKLHTRAASLLPAVAQWQTSPSS